MFLRPRLLSTASGHAGLFLASTAFVIGIGVGSIVGPVTPSRGSTTTATQPEPAAPEALALAPMRIGHPAEVLRVLDGDTFEARVHLWPGLDITTRVRLRGIDTPELKARCGEERMMAETAREALRAILQQGGVTVAQVALDKYGGRVVADASTRATPDVSQALLSAGLARRYAGGRRDGWCP